jgi:hypothetical protein
MDLQMALSGRRLFGAGYLLIISNLNKKKYLKEKHNNQRG